MTTVTHSTIDRDAELVALRDAIYAEHAGPQFSLRDAAECALGQLVRHPRHQPGARRRTSWRAGSTWCARLAATWCPQARAAASCIS
jgi:hypothetical protein